MWEATHNGNHQANPIEINSTQASTFSTLKRYLPVIIRVIEVLVLGVVLLKVVLYGGNFASTYLYGPINYFLRIIFPVVSRTAGFDFLGFVYSHIDSTIIALLLLETGSVLLSGLRKNGVISELVLSSLHGPNKIFGIFVGIFSGFAILLLTLPLQAFIHQSLHVIPAVLFGGQGLIEVPQILGGNLFHWLSPIYQVVTYLGTKLIYAKYSYTSLPELVILRLIPNVVTAVVAIRLIKSSLQNKNIIKLIVGLGITAYPLLFSVSHNGDYGLARHYGLETGFAQYQWLNNAVLNPLSGTRLLVDSPSVGTILMFAANWGIAFLIVKAIDKVEPYLPSLARKANTIIKNIIGLFTKASTFTVPVRQAGVAVSRQNEKTEARVSYSDAMQTYLLSREQLYSAIETEDENERQEALAALKLRHQELGIPTICDNNLAWVHHLHGFKFVHCSVCGSQRHAPISVMSINGVPLDIDRCADCGFFFVNPQPADEFYTELYSESYFNSGDTQVGFSNYESQKGLPSPACK
jgi:hypothetical protein